MIWTQRAEADLDEIWRFSCERWGAEQADRYIDRLNAAVSDERARSLKARLIEFVGSETYRMREARHFIYFRVIETEIMVVRVLHDSMDETLHIP